MPRTYSFRYQLPREFNQFINADVNNPKVPKMIYKGVEKGSPADIINTLCPEPSKEMAYRGITRNDAVFIDGKSVDQMISPHKVSALDEDRRAQMGNDIIAAALVSGKHRVSVLTVVDEDGRLEPRVREIMPDLKFLGDTNKREYSFIHRTFFNWGPFKCIPRAQKAEALNGTPFPVEMKKELDDNMARLIRRIDLDAFNPPREELDAPQRQDASKQRTNVRQLQNEQGKVKSKDELTSTSSTRQQKPPVKEKHKELSHETTSTYPQMRP
ncbi:MAG: hypothetical protein RR185_04150 [Angelakisella sp.]